LPTRARAATAARIRVPASAQVGQTGRDVRPQARDQGENATIRGREALIAYFERWLEAWDEFHREIEAIEVAPAEDRVFIAMRYAGKGKGSGVEVDGRFFIVASLRDGRIHRGREYADRAPALAAFKPTG
jgi:ketosteroid isomerase-like protein